MQNFTRSNVRQMQVEIAEVLNNYGFKNVEFADNGGARFSSNECTFKVVGKIAGTLSRGESRLAQMAAVYGISDITKVGPKGEKLTEFVDRRHKYPFGYVTVRGAQFKATVDQAKRMFA